MKSDIIIKKELNVGTWEIGFFDNDMACDWENEINTDTTLTYIEQAFTPVINNQDDSLDIDLANRSLAAAEALARVLKKDGEHNSYTKHLDSWIEQTDIEVPSSLTKLALDTIELVIDSESELMQYWKIRGEFDNWISLIEQLKDRLKL